MAHAGQNAIAVIQDTIFRRNGTRATIAALEGNNTNAMAAFEFRNTRELHSYDRQVEGKTENLEIPERIQMAAVAGKNLGKELLGDKGRAAYVVKTELHIRAFARGIVQAGDNMRDMEDSPGNLYHHKVRVVRLGNRRNNVCLFDTGANQHIFIESETLQRCPVEISAH